MVPQGERMKTERVQSRAWGPGRDTSSQEGHTLRGPVGLGGAKYQSWREAGLRPAQGSRENPSSQMFLETGGKWGPLSTPCSVGNHSEDPGGTGRAHLTRKCPGSHMGYSRLTLQPLLPLGCCPVSISPFSPFRIVPPKFQPFSLSELTQP